MRRKYARIVAIAMAALAGGLAAFALRPAAGTSSATLAARNPAVEIRTQVIRRTIHVIRHEHGAHMRGSHGAAALLVARHPHARSAPSGAHHAARGSGTSAGAVATRTSGARGTSSGNGTASAAPVATRSSGSHSTSPAPASAGHPVSTRSSGSHSGSTAGSSSGRPVTRSSGAGHGHGEDGGDEHRGD